VEGNGVRSSAVCLNVKQAGGGKPIGLPRWSRLRVTVRLHLCFALRYKLRTYEGPEPYSKLKRRITMASRTADGKHTKRFIILKKGLSDLEFTRSYNLSGFYETKERAQAAISYKVRQK
jgi:hypothetical protein